MLNVFLKILMEELNALTYFGSVIDEQGGGRRRGRGVTGEYVITCTDIARAAFIQLKKRWTSREPHVKHKTHINNSNVKSVLLYGTGTWTTTKTTLGNVQAFINSKVGLNWVRWLR